MLERLALRKGPQRGFERPDDVAGAFDMRRLTS